jgi:hypothetical protein
VFVCVRAHQVTVYAGFRSNQYNTSFSICGLISYIDTPSSAAAVQCVFSDSREYKRNKSIAGEILKILNTCNNIISGGR